MKVLFFLSVGVICALVVFHSTDAIDDDDDNTIIDAKVKFLIILFCWKNCWKICWAFREKVQKILSKKNHLKIASYNLIFFWLFGKNFPLSTDRWLLQTRPTGKSWWQDVPQYFWGHIWSIAKNDSGWAKRRHYRIDQQRGPVVLINFI